MSCNLLKAATISGVVFIYFQTNKHMIFSILGRYK